jgi:DNA-binding protein Alba
MHYMGEQRIIYVGHKARHLYIRAVVMAMEGGERDVVLVARGGCIRNAVDVAEMCRRRFGYVAEGLPENMSIAGIESDTEEVEREDGQTSNVSVLKINLIGEGDIPPREEE